MNQNKKGKEEKEKQEQQQNRDTLIYFQSVVKDILQVVKQQLEELQKYIQQVRADSLNVAALTYLPLFQLKRLVDGGSVDRILATYIRQFPGEKSAKDFAAIMVTTAYLYSQLLLFPEESKRAILYDYERKREYQQLFKEAYALVGTYMIPIDPAHPTPGAVELQQIMEEFWAHHINNHDLAFYHQRFFCQSMMRWLPCWRVLKETPFLSSWHK